jgi:hypothetical protein
MSTIDAREHEGHYFVVGDEVRVGKGKQVWRIVEFFGTDLSYASLTRGIGELLVATEAHPDPLVRATRKIVTQAAIALHQIHAASRTSGSDATASVPLPPTGSISPSEPEPAPPRHARASSPSVLLMRERGIEASQVRSWCAQNGIDYPQRGSLSLELVQAYLNAPHQPEQEQAS